MDEVAIGAMGVARFMINGTCLAVEIASRDSPSVELATDMLSVQGES